MTNEDDFHLNIEEGTCLFPIDVVSNVNEDHEIVIETVDTIDYIYIFNF